MPNLSSHRLILCYLGLPAFIFLAGFVRLEFALPLILLLGLALLVEMRGSWSGVNWANAAIYTALAALLLLVAGFPQGPFPWDWFKHWALFDALVSNDWPVTVEVDGTPQSLRYYVGAYLLPALLSKLTSITGWLTFALWLGFGFTLLMKLVGSVSADRGSLQVLAACLLFLAVAGADAWMMLLLRSAAHAPPAAFLGIHSEWWMYTNFHIRVQFSSILTALLWVPHQSIASFLVAGLLLLEKSPERMGVSVLAYGFLALWSPFGMLGLLPMIVLRAWQARAVFSVPRFYLSAGAAVSYAALVTWYLVGGAPEGTFCLSCVPERLYHALPVYLIFWYAELCFFLLVLGRRLVVEPDCLVSMGVLLILPLVVGDSPDLVMRVSLGPLCVLALRSVQVIILSRGAGVRLALALALSTPTVLSEVIYHLQSGRAHAVLAEKSENDPLGMPWYYTFAEGPGISLEQYLAMSAPQVHAQYFSRKLPGMIRPADN